MKISTKAALLSALTIATLLSSSLAMAQLTPGKIEDENRRGQPQQHGLTPGQIEQENNQQHMEDARERERMARARMERERQLELQRERDARAFQERERIRIEMERRAEERRQEMRREARRQEQQRRMWEEQQRNEAIARENMRLAEEARRLQEERDALARQGSASVAFSGVTRKAGGEFLRVLLAEPMQLSSIAISVLEAKAKTHQVIVHADNGQSFELQADSRIVFSSGSAAQIKDLRGIANRITAIDIRVESMGAKSVISVQVNSPEGTPSLSKQKFAAQ